MPYNKKTGTYTLKPKTKRTIRKLMRNYKPSNSRYSLPRQMAMAGPFKRTMYAKLPYTESITSLTSGTLGVFGTEAVYRFGSIFDPLFAIGGHQPIGRDILAQIYNKYKVYGLTVEIIWDDAGADGAIGGVMVSASGDSTTLTGMTLETALEKPNVFRRYINNTGSQFARFKQYFNIGRIEGLTKSQFNNDINQYCANMATDPALSPFLRIAVANIAESSGIKCHASVKLTYHVKFYDPVTLAKS